MANLDKTVNIIFAGKDELSVTTRKLYKELGDFGGGVTALSGSLSSLADKVLMTDAALLALVAGGLTYAVKKSSEFNQGFALISTSVDATGDKLAKYRQDVIDYGTTSVKSYQEVNAALYTAAQAGIKYTDSIDFMRKSEELAVANNANLNTTVDLLTGTMNAYGYKLKDVGHLNDVFFQSTLIGKQTIDDLGQSMGQVVGIAATSGVSFEELSAAIATLTAKGMNTAEAITAVRGVITTIISPSKEASNAATELGMTFSASSLKAKGFTQMLIDIMEKTGGSTDKLALLFNEMRAMNGIMQLTGDKMVFFNDAMKQIANSAGVSTDAYNKMVVTFKNQSQQVMNIVEAMLFSIGTKIEPMLAEFAKGLGSVFAGIKIGIDKGYFDELFVYLETQGKSLVLMLQKIAKNIPAVMEQINWDGVLKSFDNLGSSIKQAFQAVFGNIDLSTLDGLRIFVQKLVDGFAALNNVTAGIIDGMKPLFMMIGAGADQFSKMSEGTAELAGNVLGMAKSFYITTTYLEPLKDVFQILASAGFLVVNIGNLTTAINTMTASVGFMNAAVAMSPLGLAAVVASAGLATGAALNYAGFMEEEGKQLGEDIYDFFHGPSGAEQIGKQLTKMAEEATKTAGPIRMVAIDRMVEQIRYKAQILARTNKPESGVMDSGLIGFAIGMLIALVLIVVPAYLVVGWK